jgi:protein transport protein SEC23
MLIITDITSACTCVITWHIYICVYLCMQVCNFCLVRNHLPTYYHGITYEQKPAELYPSYTSIDYIIPPTTQTPSAASPSSVSVSSSPTFLFVIDICTIHEELQHISQAILQSLMLLPENSRIGLITYDKHVYVHELSYEHATKTYVLRGDRHGIKSKDGSEKKKDDPYTTNEVAKALRLNIAGSMSTTASTARPVQNLRSPHQTGARSRTSSHSHQFQQQSNKFFLPVADAEYTLTNILQALTTREQYPAKTGDRQERCTGTAISAAISLVDAVFNQPPQQSALHSHAHAHGGQQQQQQTIIPSNVRIMCFISG